MSAYCLADSLQRLAVKDGRRRVIGMGEHDHLGLLAHTGLQRFTADLIAILRHQLAADGLCAHHLDILQIIGIARGADDDLIPGFDKGQHRKIQGAVAARRDEDIALRIKVHSIALPPAFGDLLAQPGIAYRCSVV